MEKIGINYKTLPALKICRMSVHKDYGRRGLGTIMITYALKIALRMNQGAGCRFLTLESKNTNGLPERNRQSISIKRTVLRC